MLVLTRKENQTVVILAPDGSVQGSVTIMAVKGERVRVGFDFPVSVRIDRLEVHEERCAHAAAAGEVGKA